MKQIKMYDFYAAVSIAFLVLAVALSVATMAAGASPDFAIAAFVTVVMVMVGLWRMGNAPRFKVGDVLVPKSVDSLESWERDRVYPIRIEAVGERSYQTTETSEMFDDKVFTRTRDFFQVNERYRLARDEDMIGLPVERALGYQLKGSGRVLS